MRLVSHLSSMLQDKSVDPVHQLQLDNTLQGDSALVSGHFNVILYLSLSEGKKVVFHRDF